MTKMGRPRINPEKCSIEDCSSKAICLTWCNKHYHRYYDHGDPLYTPPKLFEKHRRLYSVWSNMKSRCFNENHKSYEYYGGRGIKVCDRWRYSFKNFLEDMNNPPSYIHSIDRIDNNGNYEPGNCRWVTSLEQEFNKGLAKNNKTGVKGVAWEKTDKRYIATVTIAKKTIYLGSYIRLDEAKDARLAGELKYYGRYVTR